ncbi:DUF262 domain-containing protein, partial [Escherichia coli]
SMGARRSSASSISFRIRLIFESMNSTGKALSQADMVRNFILMGLEPEPQTRLYEDHWRPMEVAFVQQGYSEYFDGF